MTTFGITNFENETASQFISEINTNGHGLISVALERAMDEDEPLTIFECEEALIAAEIIAASLGKPATDFPEEMIEWIGQFLPEKSTQHRDVILLAEKAADAIDRVVTNSELRELWDEHPQFNEWFETQMELQKRLLDH